MNISYCTTFGFLHSIIFLNHILHGSFPLAQNNNLRDELNGDELNEWQKQKPHKRLINITDQN